MATEQRTVVTTSSASGFFKTFLVILFVGILLVLALICGGAAMVASTGSSMGSAYEEVLDAGTDSAKVLVVDVAGPIGMQSMMSLPGEDSIERRISEAADAASKGEIAGILLSVDSPGGSVAVCDRAYYQLKQAVKDNPNLKIYAHFKGLAASGGYYISCAAGRIFCEPTCITGSIGVIMESYDMHSFLRWLGVSVEVYKSGEKKDMLSPFRAPTEDEKKQVQSIIDEEYGRFVAIVEAARGLSHEKVLALADGGIYSSKQAFDLGLVDQIAYEDEVYKYVRNDLKKNVSFVAKRRKRGLLDLLGVKAEPSIEQRVEAMMKLDGTPVLLYMWKR
ncbi:MAG: signal peptide peptidase SppA [Candidatus Brocadiia bacterium]